MLRLLIMSTEKYLVDLSVVVPVRCMQTTTSVTLKRLSERTHLDSCRGWNRALIIQLVLYINHGLLDLIFGIVG